MQSTIYTIKDMLTSKSAPVFEQSGPGHHAAVRYFNSYMRSLPVFVRPDYKLIALATIDHDTDDIQLFNPPIDVICGQTKLFADEEVTHASI